MFAENIRSFILPCASIKKKKGLVVMVSVIAHLGFYGLILLGLKTVFDKVTSMF